MNVFSPGDGVEIQNLSARADLNGCFARLREPSGDRWVVALEDGSATGQRVKVRAANLQRRQASSAWGQELNREAVKLMKAGDLMAAEACLQGVGLRRIPACVVERTSCDFGRL